MAPTSFLDKCSESDLKRFAVCFLCCDRGGIDWDAAAAMYDPTVQVASFKTVTNRALKKISTVEGGEDNVNREESATPTTPKAKKGIPGKKRKAAAESDGEEALTSSTKKKAKATPRKGKAKGKKVKEELLSQDENDDEETLDKPTSTADDADDEDIADEV